MQIMEGLRCVIESLILPWPSSKLRPNASSPGAWRIKQTAAKAYKADCAIACRAAGLEPYRGEATKLHLTMRFNPPDNRRRDIDNMLAQSKVGIDAIAEAVGVDDYHFDFSLVRGSPVKGGQLVVSIHEGDA